MPERIIAYFHGLPGSDLDKAADAIFESYGGKHIGSGTMMIGPAAGERDVEYEVPDDRADDCKAVLTKAGFRLRPTVA